MHRVNQSRVVPFTKEEMYNLVNDITSYPKFIAWCSDAYVEESATNFMKATLIIKKGLIKQQFTTINTLHPPVRIDLRLEKGPFKELYGYWHFEDLQDEGCRVTFELDFSFNNSLFNKLFEGFFHLASKSILQNFVTEAHKRYDK